MEVAWRAKPEFGRKEGLRTTQVSRQWGRSCSLRTGYSDSLSSWGADCQQDSVSSSLTVIPPALVSSLYAVSGSSDYPLGLILSVPPLTAMPRLSCFFGHFSRGLLVYQFEESLAGIAQRVSFKYSTTQGGTSLYGAGYDLHVFPPFNTKGSAKLPR